MLTFHINKKYIHKSYSYDENVGKRIIFRITFLSFRKQPFLHCNSA